ncbi:interactor of constitutive active ROPs 2, chloroplastic isoform X2 [Beta vulgaris subsp. vulgaris]|uniref:interactor of constitutive active ROPs 2, chloroplastic isoform X2 n=1 Tax=Beta vulgaris subsp. vulgaris TaxID=3555 RepID=UPI00053FE5EC|nr:interactor of constitutive active ROPs 2, chloroplastic isoform X2 [Beta vulgaris subsp. vulgaris]XP_057252238.1 interactor of constitutive active ROPs 2, chloroplastic isoform X2 [Beta vulgaris subsp. vulgaris]
MQTPKARNGSSNSEVPPRTSPSTKSSQKSSPSTNRIDRQLKVAGSGSASGSITPPNSLSKTPKKRSPKVLERGSPRSPMTEKHTPIKLSELESQLGQLQDEFKRAKDQLNSSEASKRRAQQEADETKKQLSVMSERLEDSQQQLIELSSCEDARVQELRKLSQERDRVWQSELEAIQKQHSMDSAALASALNEIQKLKRQLEMVADSEATQSMHAETAHAEIENLREELSETFLLVENLRKELNECKRSEARTLEVAREAQLQLQETMKNAENLRFEALKAKEAYNSLVSELEQSKGEVTSLENLVRKFKEDLENRSQNTSDASEIMPKQDNDGKKDETNELKAEIDSWKLEVGQLKSALEASELRYQEEYIQSTLQIRNAFDQVEQAKSYYSAREAKLDLELKKANGAMEELKSEIMTKDTVLQNISEDNKKLSMKIEENEINLKKSELEGELKKLKEDLQGLKTALLDKEIQFQHTTEENEKLKAEIQKREDERSKVDEEAALLAKAAENEVLMKLGCVTEEANKSSQRAARAAEQLDAAQTANSELEAELRRLKVQSDQWRKAAEAAANMLSTGSNGKFVDRTSSLDSSYNTLAAKMDSPLSDDMDDDSLKKKNGNMLKKIGVLWKKGQK